MKIWILLTLAGLSILWGNPAFSQPIIQIRGTEDSLAMRNQVALYLDYLEVRENVFVSVVFSTNLPEKLEGMTFCVNPKAPNTYQIIGVRIDARLNKTKQRLVLAHEMIHVRQYAKGELIVMNDHQVRWKGRKYHYQQTDRQKAPWEQEAYRTDNVLARLYKDQLEAPLVAVVKNQ